MRPLQDSWQYCLPLLSTQVRQLQPLFCFIQLVQLSAQALLMKNELTAQGEPCAEMAPAETTSIGTSRLKSFMRNDIGPPRVYE